MKSTLFALISSLALSVAVIAADDAPKEKKACDATKPAATEGAKDARPCPIAKAKKAEAEKAAAEAAKAAEKK